MILIKDGYFPLEKYHYNIFVLPWLGLHIIGSYSKQKGISTVAPFIPIISKQLGFSSVSIGWIQTACPVLAVFFKPFIGAFADKVREKKSLFISLILVSMLCAFCIQWIHPVGSEGLAEIRCGAGRKAVATLCSLVLKEQTYIDLIHSRNQTTSCKVRSGEGVTSGQGVPTNRTGGDLDTGTSVQFGNMIEIQEGCVSLEVVFLNSSQAWECVDGQVRVECTDHLLHTLLRKPLVGDLSVLSTNQFWILIFLAVGNYAGFSASNSLGDAITFTLLGNKSENYGMQRAWGSMGWGIFSVLSGVIVDKLNHGKFDVDYTASFYIMLSLILIDCLVTSKLQIEIVHKSESIKKDVKRIFGNPKVIIFAVWCFSVGVLFSFIWNFLFWFLEDLVVKTGSHGTRSWIKTLEGLLQALQCLAEGPVIFYSGSLIKRIGLINTMTIVLFGFGARLLLYTLLSNPWWILPIELLNGITFGMFYPAMTSYASCISPPGTEATVQNIFSSLYEGAGTAAGSLVGGYLVDYLGVSRTFRLVGLAGLVLGFLHMAAQHLVPESPTHVDVNLLTPEQEIVVELKEAILKGES